MARNNYRFEIAEQIVERICDGEAMTAICADLKIAYTTVAGWDRDNVSGFRDKLLDARRARGGLLLDEILTIADDCPLHAQAIARAGLQIKARQYALDRLCPKSAVSVVPEADEPHQSQSPAEFLAAWSAAHPDPVKVN